MSTSRTPIQLRDTDGTARAAAARIAKRNKLAGGITGAIQFALEYTDSAQRTERAPLNYRECSDSELRTLIIHGYDYITRSMALDTLLARGAASLDPAAVRAARKMLHRSDTEAQS